MKIKKEYIINFGLLKKDMKTKINKNKVIKRFSNEFKKIGILGFNSNISVGQWNGKFEDSLNINFINTFKAKENQIKGVLSTLRDEFNQDSVLLRSRKVEFDFI